MKKKKRKMRLRSVGVEAAACRKAWASTGITVLSFAWHCHHSVLLEELNRTAEARISYIETEKPDREKALRFRLFRPVSARTNDELHEFAALIHLAVTGSAVQKTQQQLDEFITKAHVKECQPDCPWDGNTIFSGKGINASKAKTKRRPPARS